MQKIKIISYCVYGFGIIVPLVFVFRSKSPQWLANEMFKFGKFLQLN